MVCLEVALLLALKKSGLGLCIVNLALFQLLLDNLDDSLLDFFSKVWLILISNVGASFVESALDIFPNQVLKKGSGSWMRDYFESFNRVLEGLLLRVDHQQPVSGR